MSNLTNSLTFGDGFNVTAQAPIDARVRVSTLADLTAENSWNLSTHPPYKGMIVSVMETGDVYVLLDASNPYDINNWKAQGKGNSSVLLTQAEYDALESIEDNTIYYIYEEDGN